MPMVHTVVKDDDLDPTTQIGEAPAGLGALVGVTDDKPATDRQTFLEAARAKRQELVERAVELNVAIPTWDGGLRATFKPLGDDARDRLSASLKASQTGKGAKFRDWTCGLIGEACVGLTLDGVDIGSGVHGGFGPDFAFIVELPPGTGLAALVWSAMKEDESVLMPFADGLRKWFADPTPTVHEEAIDGPFGAS